MPIGWGLNRKALAKKSSLADGTVLRRGEAVVPGVRRDGFLFDEDFVLIVFGGIGKATILGLMLEGKQEQQATEWLEQSSSSTI